MAQQTAVMHIIYNLDVVSKEFRNMLFTQALEMEKEQRIKDYNAGYNDAQCNHVNDAENYVNEQSYLADENTTY